MLPGVALLKKVDNENLLILKKFYYTLANFNVYLSYPPSIFFDITSLLFLLYLSSFFTKHISPILWCKHYVTFTIPPYMY